ncbi:3-carboxyethylcatechol 2,3-dioxygenase [Derxia gummosa]|uniref:2,3-dihydroxyphenylpropionate/2,3-dihydroxicinnamic acid 1,2-dioxygenase n=1 Tax=Derxia gummosa DSM 723 TaxID=1121388 RepID=A0A8B6X4R3_9BURK|nr:3-carboxyethylcatechol 2,3-dioxygenase [Derxia gummosa]
MRQRLVCLSHTPLKGHVDPLPAVVAEVAGTVAMLRAEVERFAPELIVLFAPDHYNGFFLDLMPQFCIGVAATSVGDYSTSPGPLDIPRALAEDCAAAVVANGIDLAVSWRMQVDHGFAQPLEELTGGLARHPVLPLFINSVAPPLVDFKRAREFGAAVGRFLRGVERRVLVVGSGGLSHNPPVPQLRTAAPEVAERIIAGRNPTPEARAARQQRTIDAARAFAAGSNELRALNPDWDRRFMRHIETRDWPALDAYRNDDITADGGASAHEVKTWVAAAAAFDALAGGRGELASRYYRAIPEWVAGFGALTSAP